MYQQDVEHADVYSFALLFTVAPLKMGNVVAANYALFFLTMPMAWGQSLSSNVECSRQAGY